MTRLALLAAAAVLAPTAARAEFNAQRPAEIRPVAKRVAKAPVKPVVEQTRLSIDDMLGKINGVYMNGLRRCYNKALQQNPTVGGKLTVSFTVAPTGRINPDVTGAAEVLQCVSTQARLWKFEIPENAIVPTEETFQVSLILAAN